MDLLGAGGHVRTVPVPDWVHQQMEEWLNAAAIQEGKVFRTVNKAPKVWGEGISEQVVWHVVKQSAKAIVRTRGVDRPCRIV